MENYTVKKRGVQTECLIGCPVRIEGYNILSDETAGTDFLQFRLKNISGRVLESAVISIYCFNDAMDAVASAEDVAFEGLDIKDGGYFGETGLIELDNAAVTSAKVVIEKAVFDDGIWENTEHLLGIALPFCDPKEFYGKLYQQFSFEARKADLHAVTAFADGDDFWLCPCGQGNPKEDKICNNCHADYEQVAQISNKAYLATKAREVFEEIKTMANEKPKTSVRTPVVQSEEELQSKKISMVIVVLAWILAVMILHWLYGATHNVDHYLHLGYYNKAYGVAEEGQKAEIVKENAIAYSAQFIPSQFSDRSSFVLCNGWSDGDMVVIEAAGNLHGRRVTGFWCFEYSEEDGTYYGTSAGGDNYLRPEVKAVMGKSSNKLSTEGVDNINKLFKANKLYIALIPRS